MSRYSHTAIVLCTARVNYVKDIIINRFSKFISSCLNMNNPFVFYIISDAMHLAYSFVGYNYLFGKTHSRFFNSNDLSIANTIRFYRHVYLWSLFPFWGLYFLSLFVIIIYFKLCKLTNTSWSNTRPLSICSTCAYRVSIRHEATDTAVGSSVSKSCIELYCSIIRIR